MSDEIKVQSKNKKTKLIIVIAAVVIAVLTIVAIVLASSNSATAKQVKEQLSLGEKYLSELQYEQAIAAYELAIEIDPKSADAYLGLAEVYEEMGEFDKAIEILEEAKAVVGDEDSLKRVEEKLKAIEERKQEALKPVATATPEPTPTPEPTATPEPTTTPKPTKQPVVREGTLGIYRYEVIDEKEVIITKITDDSVTELVIPETIEELPVTGIGNGIHQNYIGPLTRGGNFWNLKTVKLPKTIKKIGDQAFLGCYNLAEIEFPEGLVSIEDSAFAYCGFTAVKLSENVNYIGEGAFRGCYNLLKIEVAEGNKNYMSMDGVLYSKDGKTLLQYPTQREGKEYVFLDGVTRIGDGAFEEVDNLVTIDIPDSVEEIGWIAFARCKLLSELYLPSKVKELHEWGIGIDSCPNLVKIEVAKDNACFAAKDNDLYTKDLSELIAVLPTKNMETYQIASSVESIRSHAFPESIKNLTEFEIPGNVKKIGQVFELCDKLEKLIIPASVEESSDYMISACPNVTIYTTAGSYAESYAKENNIPVVIQ